MSSPVSIEPEPSDQTILLSALGWIGVIFLFVLIVAVAYLPNRAASVEEKLATERYEVLRNVKIEQAKVVDSYAWVNEAEGQVRIPVERAMLITVGELKAREIIGNEVPGR